MSEFVSREICPSCKHEFISHANPYINQLRAERDGDNERAGLLLKAKNEWADRARAAEEEASQIRAAISRPETVFIGMKRGTIAKPSLRSMIDLYGDVPNGEEQQLLEIARLRAEVEALRKDAERYQWMRSRALRFRNDARKILGNQPPMDDLEFDAETDAAMAAKEG